MEMSAPYRATPYPPTLSVTTSHPTPSSALDRWYVAAKERRVDQETGAAGRAHPSGRVASRMVHEAANVNVMGPQPWTGEPSAVRVAAERGSANPAPPYGAPRTAPKRRDVVRRIRRRRTAIDRQVPRHPRRISGTVARAIPARS
ncbi:hypothetical protein GCM10009677_24250 [Sphaerisporangium rubeum]